MTEPELTPDDLRKVQKIFGPPGCGKTSYLAERIRRTAQEIGGEHVAAISFTRAAARELAGRDLPIPARNVSTLHAMALHATDLEGSDIADKHIADFSEDAPPFRLTAQAIRGDDWVNDGGMAYRETGGTPADGLRKHCEINRAQLLPLDKWDPYVRGFYDQWCNWKKRRGYIDFTDMIEIAAEQSDAMPGSIRAAYFDECQDFTPLEWKLVRRWIKALDHAALCGDDDQILYWFKGARAEEFLMSGEDENVRVLSQSYRVPRKVHAAATHWISQLKTRQPKEYAPRDAEGSLRVVETDFKYRSCGLLAQDIEARLNEGKSAMVLGSCAYMLTPLMGELKSRGMPYRNQYRTEHHIWNPFGREDRKSVASVDRVLAYLGPRRRSSGEGELWTAQELEWWLGGLHVHAVLKHGARKKTLRDFAPTQFVPYNVVESIFQRPTDLVDAIDGLEDLYWFERSMAPTKTGAMHFAASVARRRGVQSLIDDPQITIGTMHSVKGGEADVVYIFPDLSPQASHDWWVPGAPHDAIVRLFYVAMTRAREELVICGPSSERTLKPPDLVPWNILYTEEQRTPPAEAAS